MMWPRVAARLGWRRGRQCAGTSSGRLFRPSSRSSLVLGTSSRHGSGWGARPCRDVCCRDAGQFVYRLSYASTRSQRAPSCAPCGAARRTVALDGWPCPGHGLHQRLRVMYVAEQDGPEFVFVLSVNLAAPPACLSAEGRPLRLAQPPFWRLGWANRPNGSEIVGLWTPSGLCPGL